MSAGVEPDCSFLLRVCGGTGLLSMELFRTENGAGSSAHRLPKTAQGSLTLQGRFVALALRGTQLKTVSESCFNFYFHLFSLFFFFLPCLPFAKASRSCEVQQHQAGPHGEQLLAPWHSLCCDVQPLAASWLCCRSQKISRKNIFGQVVRSLTNSTPCVSAL